MASTKETPGAFFDTNGILRSWETADPLPKDWTGIAKYNDTLFVIGRDGDERSYTALNEKSVSDARKKFVAHTI